MLNLPSNHYCGTELEKLVTTGLKTGLTKVTFETATSSTGT